MKKVHIRNYILLIFASILLPACSLEKSEGEGVISRPAELVIRASQGGASRTVMGDVGVGSAGSSQTINWTVGDKIKVWAKKTEANAPFVFNGTTFLLSTFNSTYNSADFKAWAGQMEAGMYNYYGVYPEPESIIDDKTVVYTIPSVQNGAYNPALDVMVANTTGRELVYRTDMNTTIGYPEEPSLSFEHLFHLIRIRVPENKLGGAVKYLTIIFPGNVVGKVSFDVSKLTDSNFDITNGQFATWSEMSNKVTIELPDEDLLNANGRYVWVHIKPGELSGNLRMRACSNEGVISQEVVVANFSKTMEAGHITPMALTVPASDETAYKEITFRCPDDEQYPNFLGEVATKMYVRAWPTTLKPIASQGTTLESATGEFKAKFYYLNNDDYKFNTSSSINATMSASFASAHADMSGVPFDKVRISSFYTPANYALPYLFFEDFASVGDISSNDQYKTSSAGARDAVSIMSGWTGARIGASAGKAIRIACRRETSADYTARVDSAPLKRIVGNVDVGITYNYGMNKNEGGLGEGGKGQIVLPGYVTSNEAYPSNGSIYVWVVVYGYQDYSKIKGVFAEDDRFAINETSGSYDYMPHIGTYKLSGRNSSTRLTWATVNEHQAGANNGTYWLYIDNVKVSVGSAAKHTNLNYRDYFPNHTN